jgi:hypothetical protein
VSVRTEAVQSPPPGPAAVTGAPEARLLALAERLEAYAHRYEALKDPRCTFTYTYTLLTRRLAAGFPKAAFADPAWVVALAEAFAAHYFRALDAFDQGTPAPGAWAGVFDTICRRRTSVLEELVFSMTAHLVQDLPLALTDVGLVDAGQVSHVHDFHRVNDILGEAIGPIQDAIAKRYYPLLRLLDRLAEGHDEIFTNYGFRLSRGVAWYNAGRLLDPSSKAEAAESIQRSPQIVIDQVMNPPLWSLRILGRLLRWTIGRWRRWPAARPVQPRRA